MHSATAKCRAAMSCWKTVCQQVMVTVLSHQGLESREASKTSGRGLNPDLIYLHLERLHSRNVLLTRTGIVQSRCRHISAMPHLAELEPRTMLPISQHLLSTVFTKWITSKGRTASLQERAYHWPPAVLSRPSRPHPRTRHHSPHQPTVCHTAPEPWRAPVPASFSPRGGIGTPPASSSGSVHQFGERPKIGVQSLPAVLPRSTLHSTT